MIERVGILCGVLLGWGLGANDAANVFGPAVASRMIRFGRMALMASAFVVIGAYLEGSRAVGTVSRLGGLDAAGAAMAVGAAGATVAALTCFRLPVSTSQAIAGAILGRALAAGGPWRSAADWGVLARMVVCWVTTPVGAVLLAMIFHRVGAWAVRWRRVSFIRLDGMLRWGLVGAGCYGAYALGANNAANVTGALAGSAPLGPRALALVGGGSIALGMLTCSRPVILTIGKDLVRLDSYSAFIVVLASAATVHFYARLGVPVSTSQAAVGAVVGIGLIKGVHTVSRKTLAKVGLGWVVTPLLAAGAAMAISALAAPWAG